jgi:hypothetical protein
MVNLMLETFIAGPAWVCFYAAKKTDVHMEP